MMKPILLFLSLTITSLGFSQKDTVYTFYIGGSNILYDFFEVNNDRCQIHFYGGGCLTTDSIEKIKEQHNSVTDVALKKRYGENWRELYDTQVKEREQKRLKIDSILIHQDFLKERLTEKGFSNWMLVYFFEESKRKGWITVYVTYYLPNADTADYMLLFKLDMQLDKIKIKILEDKEGFFKAAE